MPYEPSGLQVRVTEFETGAIRDVKVVPSSWEKFSLPALRAVAQHCKDHEFNNWSEYSPLELVGFAINSVYDYISHEDKNRNNHLCIAFRHLMYAYEIKMNHEGHLKEVIEMRRVIGNESQGSNHLHLLSYIALKRLAETRYEGGVKYGSWNWINGFPIMSVLSHALEHMWAICGAQYDEDHWGHAFCNLMFAIHFTIFRPDLIKGQLGPNYTLTDEIKKELEKHRALREKMRHKEEADEQRLRESTVRDEPRGTRPFNLIPPVIGGTARNDHRESAEASPVEGWAEQRRGSARNPDGTPYGDGCGRESGGDSRSGS